jgi:hypothetical protein
MEPLTTHDGLVVEGLDALAIGRSLYVTVLGSVGRLTEQPKGGLAAEHMELLLIERVAGDPDHVTTLLTVPGSIFRQPNPVLVHEPDGFHLLCAIEATEKDTSSARAGAPYRVPTKGHLYYLKASNDVTTLLQSSEIPIFVALNGDLENITGVPVVSDVEIVHADTRRVALFTGPGGLFGSETTDGKSWSVPYGIASFSNTLTEGLSDASSICARANDKGGRIVWIDSRHTTNNLLIAIATGQDQSLRNNDVFSLPLSSVIESETRPSSLTPDRLTRGSSHARIVQAQPMGDSLWVIWAGRSRVGRTLESFGEPPQLFWTRLPLGK